MWTYFSRNHEKLSLPEQQYIFIEASIEEAKLVFYNRLGYNPEIQSCYCCDADYDIEEFDTLEQATAWFRGCVFNRETSAYEERFAWDGVGHYETLEEFIAKDDVMVIREEDILPVDRQGSLPETFKWDANFVELEEDELEEYGSAEDYVSYEEETGGDY